VSAALRVAVRLLAERTGTHLSGGLEERLAACLNGGARASGQALEREVLPALRPPVVVWSAGCANGQEAYSLAMVLAGSGHPDWQVVATDISAAAVARARAGRYPAAELAGLPPVHRHRLRPAGELREVDPRLRRRVRVEQANLTTRFPFPPGCCQVVFCRNVLIYLARAERADFLDRLAAWLAPDGMVFLGYAESIMAPTDRFRVERVGDAFALRVVRPVGEAAARPNLPGAGARPAADEATAEEAATLVACGEAAAARGDLTAAVTAFRGVVFLDPDQPTTHFQLGRALEAGRDGRGARRAYAAALAALDRCDPGTTGTRLGGWPVRELAGVLRAKLGQTAAGRDGP
jgi:SAM-dependent methyltransferase